MTFYFRITGIAGRYLTVVFLFLFLGCQEDDFQHPLQELESSGQALTWVDIEGMKCRDGSNTGVGIRIQNKKKLMIYINGGGACFNEETCASNPDHFNEESLMNLVSGDGDPGIFSATDERNPVKDWSTIFIPYCTGDVHSGTLHNGRALDVSESQKFVGALNFKRVMEFIAPYFEYHDVEEILLFGMSAGGYGVYVNFLEIQNFFPNKQVHVINDSGPLMNDDLAFPTCLQLGFTVVFGLPVPPDLLNCCQPNLGLANVYQYATERYPGSNFGFMTSYEDQTSRFFLSFGYDQCQGAPDNILPADVFRTAVTDLRDDVLKPLNDWSTFYIEGNSHTMLADNDIYYGRQVQGVYLYEWVERLLKGEVLHVTE